MNPEVARGTSHRPCPPGDGPAADGAGKVVVGWARVGLDITTDQEGQMVAVIRTDRVHEKRKLPKRRRTGCQRKGPAPKGKNRRQ